MANESILVVDGDSRSRKILEVSFKKSGYRVLMTDSIGGALACLDKEDPDLIVSETTLPDGDGFEFCKQVDQHPDWGHIPFLFLTEESSLPRKIKGLEIGADDYLTRPIYINEVTTRAEVLLQKRDREMLAEGEVEKFEGKLSEITLIDLLQTFDSEKRTGIIEFSRGTRSGVITFREGNLIDASCGKLRGAEAVYRLMLWPSGDFVVRYHDEVPGSDRIDMTTEDLLFEGIHRIEEWDRLLEELPNLERVFDVDYEKLPDFLDSAPDQVGRIARLFDGHRTLRDVIDDSPLGDVTAAKIIRGIFAEDLLEDVTPESDEVHRASAEERSHLADWLDRFSPASETEFEEEEDTSPGRPTSGDPRETQEIERDDLASALSQQIDQQIDAQDHASGFADQEPSDSGPRYQPAGDDEPTFTFAPQDPDAEDPASVDETLRELEKAERVRRKEEAKRIVEQKPDVMKGETSETSAGEEDENLANLEEEGVPRIPGATKTRNTPHGIKRSPVEDSDVRSEADEPEEPEPPAERSQEQQEEEVENPASSNANRNRDNTPRAHPTQTEDEAAADAESGEHRSRKVTRSGVGEAGLGGDDGSGVPVSFETVDDEAPSEEPEEDLTDSSERRAVSVEEAESVKDEAAAAVRESAREALKQAESGAEGDEEGDGESDEESDGERGRERENTIPFGDASSGHHSGIGLQEITPKPLDDETDLESSHPSPEKVQRVSTNGEVVRAEYELKGPPGGGVADEVTADDTLEGMKGEEDSREKPTRELAEISNEFEPSERRSDGQSADEVEEAEEPEEDRGASEAKDGDQPKAGGEFASDFGSGTDEDLFGDAQPETGWEFEDDLEGSGETGGGERDQENEESGQGQDEESDEQEGLAWENEPTARRQGLSAEPEQADGEADDVSEPEPGEEGATEPRADDERSSSVVSSNDEEETDEVGAERVSEIRQSEENPQARTSERFGQYDQGAEREKDSAELRSKVPGESGEGAGESDAPGKEPSGEADDEDEQEGDFEAARIAAESNEVEFFEEGGGGEEGAELDWDFDDDVDRGSGRWIAAIVALVAIGVLSWALFLGPLSPSGDSGEEEVQEIAAPEEPGSEEESESNEGDESSAASGGVDESRAEPSEPDEALSPEKLRERAKSRARAAVDSVGRKAKRQVSILSTGFEPDSEIQASTSKSAEEVEGEGEESEGAEVEEAGTEGAEERVASTAASSEAGSQGGGSGEASSTSIAQARELIRNDQLSEAESTLRDLQEASPGSAAVAKLYLQLGSRAQNANRTSQARRAYQAYLEMRPEGKRAEEVRYILDNHL